MAILDVPQIKFNNGSVRTLAFPALPLDDVRAWSRPAPASEWSEGPSGVVSAWLTGVHHILEGTVRHIPDVTTGGVTGWSTANGWRDFLEWAWLGGTFDFIPDEDTPGAVIPCYLLAPREEPPPLDPNSLRRNVRLLLRSSNGSSFDGYSLS